MKIKKTYILLGVGLILAGYLLYNGRKKSFDGNEPEWAMEENEFGVPIKIINR